MPVKVNSLDHLVINVSDVARSVEWYRRLGYEDEWTHRFEPTLPAFVSIGQGVQAGFKTGIATINAAGGVNGRPLNVTTYDSQTTPGGAQQAIRQAIADKNLVS